MPYVLLHLRYETNQPVPLHQALWLLRLVVRLVLVSYPYTSFYVYGSEPTLSPSSPPSTPPAQTPNITPTLAGAFRQHTISDVDLPRPPDSTVTPQWWLGQLESCQL